MSAWSVMNSFAGLARDRMWSAAASQPSSFPSFLQSRNFSKFISKSAKKRLVLTTKRAHKGFYKGKGGTKEGRISSKGKFIVDPLKRMQIVAPDLTGFKLKPYIASSASRFAPEIRR
ncbi:hypothetical protein MPSEU_000159000 [Mayamaea pseudoterrestris]|nr:hypothetical protein MPSEU_000159000 [Mayamaea pseudoterrestris]